MAANRSRYVASHRAIREELAAGNGVQLLVAGDSGAAREIARLAGEAGVSIRRVGRAKLRDAAPGARDCALELPPGGEPAAKSLEQLLSAADAETGLVVLLDHITDPHNYGAILRSADQFGVDAVIVPGRRAAPLSAVAVQSSAGTAEYVTVVTVPNLAAAVATIKEHGFWVYAAELGGGAAHRQRLSGKTAIVLGSEGKGVSRLVAERADAQVRIPMAGHADSLNVSVACGVLLYEVRRQQGWLDRR
jgi:23S rRNA (guanosine2251-2'-O)-methyltransferase